MIKKNEEILFVQIIDLLKIIVYYKNNVRAILHCFVVQRYFILSKEETLHENDHGPVYQVGLF